MEQALLALIAFVLGFWWWSSARAAADRARELGRRACEAAHVQWLDESVQGDGFRLRRGEDGWLRPERRYRFEYSTDGQDRHAGMLVLRGTQLVAFSGPPTPTPVSIEIARRA